MSLEATRIPESELNFFKELGPLKVIFDVGARVDVDYLEIHPDAEFHLFEPNPFFFAELVEKVGNRPNVFLNNIGLGDVPKEMDYNDGRQAFIDGEEPNLPPHRKLLISTLDVYCTARGIKQIDFLKIDTEGYDFKVLLGGTAVALPLVTHLQYEYWNNKTQFHDLLERDFYMNYIGGRNVLCTRKTSKKWHFGS